jgi:hypothetical protein
MRRAFWLSRSTRESTEFGTRSGLNMSGLTEISAVPDDQLVALNVVEVVTLVLGVLAKLRALRPEIQQLPFFDLARFDRLEKYARPPPARASPRGLRQQAFTPFAPRMTMHAELVPTCGQSRGARDEIAPTFHA